MSPARKSSELWDLDVTSGSYGPKGRRKGNTPSGRCQEEVGGGGGKRAKKRAVRRKDDILRPATDRGCDRPRRFHNISWYYLLHVVRGEPEKLVLWKVFWSLFAEGTFLFSFFLFVLLFVGWWNEIFVRNCEDNKY